MNVVIVEDEKLSAEHLHLSLLKIDPNVQVISHLDSVAATVQAFENGLQADLLFLDIHLADGNSFKIFSKIQLEIPIIFTTAYDNYAIQAFKQSSIDYLLKPVSLKELTFAFEKFKKYQQSDNKHLMETITIAYQQLSNQHKTRFWSNPGNTLPPFKLMLFIILKPKTVYLFW